jgi:hypothetical protein
MKGLSSSIKQSDAAYQDKNEYGNVFAYDNSPSGPSFRARYKAYGQETFNKIGFDPHIDNEAVYNQQTNTFDDMKRWAVNAALPMVGLGFMSPINSYAGAMGGDVGASRQEAKDYEYYNALGYSSRGGAGGLTTNLLNSVSYSAGILLEGVAEGMMIGATVGAVGGEGVGAVPGTIIGGAVKGLEAFAKIPNALYQSVKNIGKISTAVGELKNINAAKNFFTSTVKGTAKFLNPLENTYDAYKSLKGVDDITRLAKTAKTAGAFWHDIMGVNLALSEGRLEGGFAQKSVYDKLYNEHYAKFGQAPSSEQQVEMMKQAKQAGFKNTIWNTGLVFYSNKIAFPSITRAGFLKNAPRFNFGKVIGEVGDEFQLVFNPADDITKSYYSKEAISLKNSLKALKDPKKLGAAGLNYFKKNLVEGVQEIGQEALAAATEKEFVDGYYNKAASGFMYSYGALLDGLGKQMNAQGAEIFGSGFLMGGLLEGPSKLFKFGTKTYSRIFKDKELYKQNLKDREAQADNIVNALNDMHQNAKYFFDPRMSNYSTQMLIAKAVDNPDDLDTKTAKDLEFHGFQKSVITALKTGTFDMFVKNLREYKTLTPEELEEAWSLEPGQGEKALSSIDKALDTAKITDQRYKYGQDKFKDFINIENFEKDSPEYQKAQIYNQAYSEAVGSFVFLQNTFDNNLGRLQKLYGSTNKIKSLSGSQFGNFAILSDPNKLSTQISYLIEEIKAGAETNDPKLYDELNRKAKLLESLHAFETVQRNILNEKGEISDEDETLYRESLQNVFEAIAINNKEDGSYDDEAQAIVKLRGEIDTNGGMDQIFNELKDIEKLKKENGSVAQYINLLADPQGFYEHINRNFEWMKNIYANRKELYKDIVNKEITDSEKNEVLNTLASQGIFVDLDEFAEWCNDPRYIPSYFIDTTKEMVIPQDSVLYERYARIFLDASRTINRKPAGEKLTDKQQMEAQLSELKTQKESAVTKARDVYKQAFLDEYGEELDAVESRNAEIVSENEELEKQKKLAQEKIEAITDALDALGKNNASNIIERVKKLTELNIISEEEFDKVTALDSTDPEVHALVQGMFNKLFTDKLSEEELLFASVSALTLPEFIVDKVEEQKEILNKPFAEVVDVQATEAFKVYTEKVGQLDAQYTAKEEDIKATYAEKGIDENTFDEINVNTPYDNMPDDLKVLIDNAFNEFLVEAGDPTLKTIDLEKYEETRANWVEQNGAQIIATYNAEKLAESKARAEQLKKPPFLKYNKKQVEAKESVAQLNQLYKQLKALSDSGKTLKGIDLTDQQKADLKEDLENLAGYLDALTKVYKPKSVAQKVVDQIVERVVNRRGEVEDVVDAEGRKTRKFVGQETTSTDAKDDIERRRKKSLNNTAKKRTSGLYKRARTIPQGIGFDQFGTLMSVIYKMTTTAVTGQKFTTPKENAYIITPETPYRKSMAEGSVYDEEKLQIAIKELEDRINAIYDAELAALGEGTTEPSKTLRRVSEIATRVAEDIAKFKYEGYNKKENILKRFSDILENEKDLNKAVDIFMSLFKQLAAKGYEQFDSKSKLSAIEKGLRSDPTLERLEKLIDQYAFIESTDAGTKVDELIRKFLTLDSGSGEGFAEVKYTGDVNINGVDYKVSDFMSQKAFDRLFGPGGIVSTIRGKMIDGEFVLFPENLLVFDKTLGITGEIDLLAVNAKGEVMIIDIKTSKKWGEYKNPNNYKNISHRAQLSIYSTLFYNMTGIKATKLQILPLQIDVNVDGYVKDIDKAKVDVLGKDGKPIKMEDGKTNKQELLAKGYYELPFLEDIAEYGVTMIEPEFETDLTEEDGDLEGTGETKDTSDKVEEIEDLSKTSLSNLLNKTVLFNGRLGKVVTLPNGSFGIEYKVTKDIDLLEQLVASLKEDLKADDLLETPDPEYRKGLEDKITELKKEIKDGNAKGGKEIVTLYYKFKPVTDSSLDGLDLGIGVVTGITFPFQVNRLNGQYIKAEFTNEDETTAIINDVRYDVIRDKTGAIAALSYRKNEKQILRNDLEIEELNKELNRIYQIVKKQNVKQKSTITKLFVLNQIAQLKDSIEVLEKVNNKLIETNDLIFEKGGNANDYIFALNTLPNSFQKATKNFKPLEEVKHLKEIDRLSLSSAVSKAITEKLNENYPEQLDTLMEKGVKAITPTQLMGIYYWIDETIDALYGLSSIIINRGDLVDDISNQINELLHLKNDLNLIKIIEDGKTKKPRISKQQGAANKVFGATTKVQKGTGVSQNEKSTGKQTKAVSGLPEQGVSTEELKQIVGSAKQIKPVFTAPKVEATENSDLLDGINNAKNETELREAFTNAINNRGDVKAATVQEAFENRKKELQNVSLDTLEKGSLLISKIAIFDGAENVVVELVSMDKNTKLITVKVYGTDTKKSFTEQELKDNFTIYSKEAMEAEKEKETPITEETQDNSTISKDNLEEFSSDSEIVKEAEKEAESIDKATRFNNLFKNSKTC